MKLRPGILVGGLGLILVAALLASYGGSFFGGAGSDGGLISVTQAAAASSVAAALASRSPLSPVDAMRRAGVTTDGSAASP